MPGCKPITASLRTKRPLWGAAKTVVAPKLLKISNNARNKEVIPLDNFIMHPPLNSPFATA
jgi:hypothetical protein